MRKFRRLCAMFAVLVVMLGLCLMPISAEETIPQSPQTTAPFTQGSLDTEESESVPSGAEGENTPVVDTEQGDEVITPPEESEPAEGENNTVISRLYEWTEANLDEILTAASVAVMGAFSLYQKNKNGTLVQGISRVLKSQGGVESVSNTVATALKAVEEKQEQINKYYEAYAKGESERGKVTAALLVEVMALVEIQHIQTLNNSNVPQAFKDLVTSKYARCLSTINDDAELKAAYDEVRGVLGIGGEADEATSA